MSRVAVDLLPKVVVKKVIISRTKGWHPLAIIYCPYCDEKHVHGAADGRRLSHCNLGDYVLVGTESAPRIYRSAYAKL